MPSTRKNADRKLLREFAPAIALGFHEASIVRSRRNKLEAGHEVRELGEIGDDHGRVRADVVKIAEVGKRRADVTLHQRLEQIDHARTVRKAQLRPDLIRLQVGIAVRDRLIKQR